jgi:hypothetical protein
MTAGPNRLLAVTCFVALLFALLVIAVPPPVTVPCATLAALLAWRRPDIGRNIALVGVSTSLSLLIGESVLRMLPAEKMPHYYRPHEYLLECCTPSGLRRYRTNVAIDFDMPHGDLAAFIGTDAVDVPLRRLVEEPRRVHFVTDDAGFRNMTRYVGQKYLLVGDSMVIGNGTTQDENLTARMAAAFGDDFYNLGSVGGIEHYASVLNEFRARTGSTATVFLFIFEGNDLQTDEACRAGAEAASPARPPSVRSRAAASPARWPLSAFEIYRLAYSLRERAAALFGNHYLAVNTRVSIKPVAGRYMAFFNPYIDETRNTAVCASWRRQANTIRSLADQIEMIVFIPTKYRVYASLASPGAAALPAVKSTFLAATAADIGVTYLDLTEPLVGAAEGLAPSGSTVFWRDDTHWNGRGIDVAARSVHALRQQRQ